MLRKLNLLKLSLNQEEIRASHVSIPQCSNSGNRHNSFGFIIIYLTEIIIKFPKFDSIENLRIISIGYNVKTN